jgi:hypothetical protein
LKKYLRGCVSLKKYKSQSKAVEVTVNSKEENSEDFCLDSVQEFGIWTEHQSGPHSTYTMYTLVLYFIILQILCLLDCPSSTILFEESLSLTLGIKQM